MVRDEGVGSLQYDAVQAALGVSLVQNSVSCEAALDLAEESDLSVNNRVPYRCDSVIVFVFIL